MTGKRKVRCCRVFLTLVLGMMVLAAPLAWARYVTNPTVTSSTSVPTPAIQSAEGSIAALDLGSENPWVRLKDLSGREWTIYLDPRSISVWQADNPVGLTELRVGDKVKIRHASKDGKEFARSIEVDRSINRT